MAIKTPPSSIYQNTLNHSKERLGEKKYQVQWVVQDIRNLKSGAAYDLWHDRALFHFLNSMEEKKDYLERLKDSLKTNGLAILSTFSEEGPLKCSGLEITRYNKNDLTDLFSQLFQCIHFEKETHLTPSKKEQHFNIWVFKRLAKQSKIIFNSLF